LRAEWGTLDNPGRIEALAKHFTALKPIAPIQFDTLDRLPERPADDAHVANDDPIGGMIGNLDPPSDATIGSDAPTGSILAPTPEAATPAADNPAPDSGTLPSPDMTPDGRGEDEALSPADEDENR
jgi:hypothetical protein